MDLHLRRPSTAARQATRDLTPACSFDRMHQTRRLRPLSKGTLAGSFLAQSLIIWTAAALGQGNAAPTFNSLEVAELMHRNHDIDYNLFAPIVLLAFQFAMHFVKIKL